MRTEAIALKDYFPFLGENDADPQLHCFFPELPCSSGKTPSMLICPGGGYWRCSVAENIAANFMPLGINAFVLLYSTNSQVSHRYPTQLREVAAAFEIIKQNANGWGCDTEKIGIMGFSAGGHLAAHYSNAWSSEVVRSVFPDSHKPFATALGYPVISAEPPLKVTGTFTNLLGHDLSETEIHDFSVQNLVTKDTPPTFIWHTSTDPIAPVMGSYLYAQALWQNKVPCEMHIYPCGKHGLSTADKNIVNSQLEKYPDLSDEAKEKLKKDINHVHNWVDAFNKWLEYTFY